MELNLGGKVAIVNGASKGIGFGIAHLLSKEGARVVISARRAEALNEAAESIRRETDGFVLAVPADTRKAEDCERIVQSAVQACGRIDVLVNNGGAPPLGAIATFDDVDWDKALQQNLMSVVRMARLVLPHMKAAGGGRIVNITALSVRQPIAGFSLSVASWAGVIGFSKTLSLEVGPDGITVNTILPGRIATERLDKVNARRAIQAGKSPEQLLDELRAQVPMRRIGQPKDIAGLVAFLASSYGSFITGTVIQADGGQQASLM